MRLFYFAWVKTKIGKAEEELDLPAEVTDVAGLLEWLKGRGPGYEDALSDLSAIRVAVNQGYAKPDDKVRGGDEVALFPPVTGG